MKYGKIIIGAVAFAISATSTLAFKATNTGTKQLFIRNPAGRCIAKLCYTRTGAAGNSCDDILTTIKLYTLSGGQCTRTYTGPRTVTE